MPAADLTNYTYCRLPKRPWTKDQVTPIFDRLPAVTKHDAVVHPVPMAERALCLTHYPREYETGANAAAVTYNNLGVENLDLNLAKSLRFFRMALTLDDQYDLAHNNLGLALLETGDVAQAVKELTKATTNEELDAAFTNLGLAYLELGQPQQAASNFMKAIRISEHDPIHWNNFGILWLDLDKPATAVDCFNQALRLDADSPMIHHNLGLAHRAAGDADQANREFIEAIRLEKRQYNAEFGEA